jgi:hypothetical protein
LMKIIITLLVKELNEQKMKKQIVCFNIFNEIC